MDAGSDERRSERGRKPSERKRCERGGFSLTNDALTNAGLPFEAVEAAWCGHVGQGSTAGQKVVGAVGQGASRPGSCARQP